MPVLLLAGEEEFELSRRLERLKAEILDPEWVSFNFTRLPGASLTAVIDAAGLLPFGPGKKLVLVEKCDLFTKKKSNVDSDRGGSEKNQKQLLEDFDLALAAVAPETFLVFACPYNFDSTLRTSKVISKYVQPENFPRKKYFPGSNNPELETWVSKEAHRQGATVEDEAIRYLLESTEADLRQMSKEIEKAVTYLFPGKHITAAVVSELSPHHSHVFELLDNWARGLNQKCLTNLEELLRKQSGMPIMAMLHTTLSKWIHLKSLWLKMESDASRGTGIQRREIPIPEVATRLSAQLSQNSYVIKMDLTRIKGISAGRLIDKRIQLCSLDKMVKTGQMSDQHALTLFFTS